MLLAKNYNNKFEFVKAVYEILLFSFFSETRCIFSRVAPLLTTYDGLRESFQLASVNLSKSKIQHICTYQWLKNAKSFEKHIILMVERIERLFKVSRCHLHISSSLSSSSSSSSHHLL